MKRILLTSLLAGALVLPAATTASAAQRGARGFGGGAMGHAVSRGEAASRARGTAPAIGTATAVGPVAHAGVPTRVVVPAYGFYPGFGWGYYDPFWYGWGGPYYYPYVVPESAVTGGLRLEVKPKTAQVFVDGSYAGVVNDFDGHFQRLTLTPGGHRIDVTAPGFEPLMFNTYIQAGHTTDYKGTLAPAPATDDNQ
jgi:hypothetical protein